MDTEAAVQRFWNASLAWRGKDEGPPQTVQSLFRLLDPLYDPVLHKSHKLSRQASELGEMIVKWKKARCRKPRKPPQNLVHLPVARKQQQTKAA